jgi:hypothetical protein
MTTFARLIFPIEDFAIMTILTVMMTHSELIDRLGGVGALSKALGRSYRSVHNWTRPGRGIPGAYWPRVCEMAGAKGISLAQLGEVQRAPSQRYPADGVEPEKSAA